jgi:hypothetical protein
MFVRRIALLSPLMMIPALASSALADSENTTLVTRIELSEDCFQSSQNVSEDHSAFTINTMDSMSVWEDAGVPLEVRRCHVDVELAPARGFSVTTLDLNYRGYAKLLAGRTGHLQISYQLQGHEIGEFDHVFAESEEASFLLSDAVAIPALGQTEGQTQSLALEIEISIDPKTEASSSDYSALAFDAIDGTLQQSRVYSVGKPGSR